jgi:hypothetical protein
MTKYERLYTADEVDGIIARAKAAPVREPVAWIFKPNRELLWPDEVERENPIELNEYEALYTTAPAQPAVQMTVDQVNAIMAYDYTTATVHGRAGYIAGFRAAEAAHGITKGKP